MANPVCTIASLNLPCFNGVVLSPLQKKALMIWFKASELKGIGGTNYTNALITPAAGGLLGDTYQLFDEKISKDNIGYGRMIGTFELAIARNTAISSGGDVDANIATRMQQIKCLINVNEDVMDRMLLFLECQLGVHKAYPQ